MSLVLPLTALAGSPEKHEVAWSHIGSHQPGLYSITACYCVFLGADRTPLEKALDQMSWWWAGQVRHVGAENR
jgi:hypothetical protein